MVTIPIEVWDGENLNDGDLIEVDIQKVEKPKPWSSARHISAVLISFLFFTKYNDLKEIWRIISMSMREQNDSEVTHREREQRLWWRAWEAQSRSYNLHDIYLNEVKVQCWYYHPKKCV